MKKYGYLILVLIFVIISLRLFASRPDGFEIVQGPTESGPPAERVITETTERVYNCGLGGDIIYLTPSESLSISESVQWEGGMGASVERDLFLAKLGAALEAKYGKGYKKSAQTGTGWQLPAKPGEWVEYRIRWSEVWQPGDIRVFDRKENKEETVKYRYRKAIKTEIIAKRLLDCDTDAVMVNVVTPTHSTPVLSPAFAATPTVSSTASSTSFPPEDISTSSATATFLPSATTGIPTPLATATLTLSLDTDILTLSPTITLTPSSTTAIPTPSATATLTPSATTVIPTPVFIATLTSSLDTDTPTLSPTVTLIPSSTTAIPTPSATASGYPIIVSGVGWSSEIATNPTQRRSTALLAAEMDAKRNLAEWLAGSDIEAVTVVEEGRVTDDLIRVEIRTHLMGTRIISQVYDDETGQATVEIVPNLADQEP